MKVCVHDPITPGKKRFLSEQAAVIHAQAIIQAIDRLSCPKEQKLYLLKLIEQALIKLS